MDTVSVRVALTPENICPKWEDMIWIVIDVLRASSTIVTLLENGSGQVYTLASADKSRILSREKGLILCGERDGLTIPGFDMGNSPVEVLNSDVRGKGVVLTTSNGTRVIKKVARARKVLIGCFLNARACCDQALNVAKECGCDIGIVCAGEKNEFVLDDAFCAGFLVEEIIKLANRENVSLELMDCARAAQRLYEGYPDILTAFKNSKSGRRVLEIGREDDFNFCSKVNVFSSVPVLCRNSYFWCDTL